ncbi:MAG TPA: MFS transporter [Anaerolineae bacterium]|nr:MFS transporter [Anaerolineae bacterium]
MRDSASDSAASAAISNPQSTTGNSLRRVIGVSMMARLVHDTANRFVYPFLPEIAGGLRIPLDQLGAVLSLRSGVGILSPVFGALSDRIGHRRAMSIGLLVLAAGLGGVGLAGALGPALLGFSAAGIGTAIYIPALQAYVSECVPYARRGRVFGAIELTWALAGMIGVPLLGRLIGPLSWRAPFIALAVTMTISAALTLILPEPPATARARAEPVKLAAIAQKRSAVTLLIAWLLVFFSFENIQVGYASWFESRFELTPVERGMAQTLFGVFEIVASGSSSLFLDRIGKKRGVTGGLLVALLGYALLVLIGPLDVRLGLAAMGVAFLGFEFSVVSGIPILSEQVPQARGTMLALAVMTSGLGRMAGAVIGGALVIGPGFTSAAWVSGVVAVGTLALFVWGVSE